MAQIVLNVKDANVEAVMHILDNLKDGLIDDISSNIKKKHSKYQPRNQIVKESEKPTGKYVTPLEYKKRIKQ